MEYLYIATDRICVSCVMEGHRAIIVNCVWVSYICIRDGIFMSQSRDLDVDFGACMMELIS